MTEFEDHEAVFSDGDSYALEELVVEESKCPRVRATSWRRKDSSWDETRFKVCSRQP